MPCRIWRKDGTMKYVEFSMLFETVAFGKPDRMVGILADITDRKKMEDILRRDKDTFQRMVKEKTESLKTEMTMSAKPSLALWSTRVTTPSAICLKPRKRDVGRNKTS